MDNTMKINTEFNTPEGYQLFCVVKVPIQIKVISSMLNGANKEFSKQGYELFLGVSVDGWQPVFIKEKIIN